MSEAPNSVSRGAANKRHMHIRIIAEPQSIVKEVFIMVLAFFSSPIPLLIENKGAPPLPKRLLKAVIIIIIGKHSPTAPRAFVPTSGILAMYTLSTILYNRLKICATSIGIAAFKILLVIVPFSKSIRFIYFTFSIVIKKLLIKIIYLILHI